MDSKLKWKKTGQKSASMIPVLMDCGFMLARPMADDDPAVAWNAPLLPGQVGIQMGRQISRNTYEVLDTVGSGQAVEFTGRQLHRAGVITDQPIGARLSLGVFVLKARSRSAFWPSWWPF